MSALVRRWLVLAVVLAAAAIILSGCAETPRQGFWGRPASDFARLLQDLFSQIVLAAAVVFVLVEALLFIAVFRFRRRPGDRLPPQTHGNTRVEVIWTVMPAVVLAFVAVPTVRTIFESYHPSTEGTLRVQVIAHQFWWEFRYPDLGVVTANEVHFPAGRRATLTLESADVIHGFWVPQLGGKRDNIPGHVNELWWTPDEPGIYYGQCTQLCGTSHANMRLMAVVHPPEGFDAWVRAMQSASGKPTSPALERGYQLVTAGACAGCHTIQDTPAQGKVGPDLTRFGDRLTLAARTYDNTHENLVRWLQDPPGMKPGNKMPNLGLNDEDAAAIASYLRSLR